MAAAGLVALDRLSIIPEDHRRAQRLSQGLRAQGFNANHPETNIVLVPVMDAPMAARYLGDTGILALAAGRDIRLVTHSALSDQDIEAALLRIEPLVDRLLATWEGDRPMV